MTKQDRQKLSVLVVLVLVLGLVLLMGYRMNRPTTAVAIEVPANANQTQTASNLPASSNDARIRLDLVEKSEEAEGKAGDKNIFSYRQAPPPPLPPPPKPVTPGYVPPSPVAQQPATPITPPAPPPPPPIPLRFEGFAVVNSGGGEMKAVLADQSRRYVVATGEFILGRYRVIRISATSVEVEDLEYNRKQTLPLLK